MRLVERFSNVVDRLSVKSKRHIHYRSINNFICHLEEIQPHEDYEKCRLILDEYICIIENSDDDIDGKTAAVLFSDYVYPLGELYKKIEFKQITPVKNAVFFAIHIDIFAWLFLFNLPYPILTSIVLANHLLRVRRHLKTTRVFGILY
jgi:hypothetical protein